MTDILERLAAMSARAARARAAYAEGKVPDQDDMTGAAELTILMCDALATIIEQTRRR